MPTHVHLVFDSPFLLADMTRLAFQEHRRVPQPAAVRIEAAVFDAVNMTAGVVEPRTVAAQHHALSRRRLVRVVRVTTHAEVGGVVLATRMGRRGSIGHDARPSASMAFVTASRAATRSNVSR